MRQLTFVEPRLLEWREVPAPVLGGDGQALVRPIASTTCDIDQWIVQGEFAVDGPFAIGHECVAEVIEVGDGVRSVKPGAIVAVPWHISCGQCDRCGTGRFAYCHTTPPTASFGLPFGGTWGGLFDEVVNVPYADAMLVPVPDGIDPVAVAAFGDNLTIPIELIGSHLRRWPNAGVLVLGRHGAGGASVSLFAADIAVALGASRVVYLDPDPARREVARHFGAIVDPGPPRRALGRFDLIFDCSTNAEVLTSAIELLEPNGAVECPGGYFQPVALDLFRMYVQGVTFHTGLASARAHIEAAFDLLTAGRIDPARVFAPPIPIDLADQALREPSTKPLFVRDRAISG
jgi:alcohol dehydrogenase